MVKSASSRGNLRGPQGPAGTAPTTPAASNVTGSGGVTIDCGTNTRWTVTMTGAITEIYINGNPISGTRVFVEVYNSTGGALTFNTWTVNRTPRSLPISVSAGNSIFLGLYYSALYPGWQVAAIGSP